MRTALSCVALLLCLLIGPSSAQLGTIIFSGGPSGLTGWQRVGIDGGGYVDGLEFECDQGVGACTPGVGTVTKIARTDTAGAWLWNTSLGKWTQLVTVQSIPPYTACNATPCGDNGWGNEMGVCEIRIAPTNTNHLYMYWSTRGANGYIYESLNKGATWTRTGFSSIYCSASADPQRLMGTKMAVDPANEAVVFVGTTSNGVWFTTNGGNGASTTWTQVSTGSVPTATSSNWNLVYFDPSGGTTTISGQTRTKNLIATSSGNGVYKSTDGGQTWSELNSAGMPSGAFYVLYVDPTGVIWINSSDSSTSIYRYNGSWTTIATGVGVINAITADPANCSAAATCHIYRSDGTELFYSANGGGSFTALTSHSVSSSLFPWFTNAGANNDYLGIVWLAFDPSVANTLYGANGVGIGKVSPPTTNAAYVWNMDATAGINNLVASGGQASPPSGSVQLTSEDRPLWLIGTPSAGQSNYYPAGIETLANITAGGNSTYMASNHANLFLTTNSSSYYGAYSYGGGAWTAIASVPSVIPGSGAYGDILAYSDTNAVWNVDDGGGPYCLTAGAISGTPTWSACTFNNGATASGGGWNSGIGIFAAGTHQATVDYVATSTYCLYNDGGGTSPAGFYSSTNGTSFTFVVGSGFLDSSGQAATMYAVPGQSGHIYFSLTLLDVEGTLPNTARHLWRTTTGCGGTFSQVPNIESLFCFGFGAQKPGNTYPSFYAIGWASTDGGVTYNYGAWRSDNINAGTPTWTNIGDGYPLGYFTHIYGCSGDNNNYGTMYVGFGGTSWAYRQLNYLLRRDIYPASNDNMPAWLTEVA